MEIGTGDRTEQALDASKVARDGYDNDLLGSVGQPQADTIRECLLSVDRGNDE